MASGTPRAVLITRRTQFEELLARHATREQARFHLETREQSIDGVEQRHECLRAAERRLQAAIPVEWRRISVERGDLDRFLFEPQDIVCVLGQDGLVANTAKYLDGQPVLGFNPEPDWNEGVLVRHPVEAAADLLADAAAGRARVEHRSMVEARLHRGERLLALNELFVGHVSHQSARYRLLVGDSEERQSSSGLIVSTGTGATGWARSIERERGARLDLPGPADGELAWFVREAWPSVATGVSLTAGLLAPDDSLEVIAEMDAGVVFGDGIEAHRLRLTWGERLRLGRSKRQLALVA